MSLYVGNLHAECNEAILYKKFSLMGKVESIKICRDAETANSLGYGYVNFSNEEDAKKAMDALNYDMICGKVIRIMWAQKNPNKFLQSANLVIKNLDSRTNELNLKEVFSPFGEVLSIKVAKNSKGDSKGYGFVQFAVEEAADSAVASLKDADIGGRKLLISKFIPAEERRCYQESTFPNNIFVSNLTSTSNGELIKMCEAFGDVVSAKIMEDCSNRTRGFGFVSFRDKESAEKAIQELNRLCLNGKRVTASFVKRHQAMLQI